MNAPDIDNASVYARSDVARRFDRERRIDDPDDYVNRTELAYFLGHARGLLDGAEPGSVIDVGAGTGKLALAFARAGWRVTAFDRSAAMLERLAAKAAAEGLEIAIRQGDAVTHGPERAFDVAVSSRMLMHVPDPAAAIRTMAGFARRGVVFDVPRARSPNRLLVAVRRWTGGEVYRCFDDGELMTTLAADGLRVTDATPLFTLPISLHLKLARRTLSERLERLLTGAAPYASTLFVTAAHP